MTQRTRVSKSCYGTNTFETSKPAVKVRKCNARRDGWWGILFNNLFYTTVVIKSGSGFMIRSASSWDMNLNESHWGRMIADGWVNDRSTAVVRCGA